VDLDAPLGGLLPSYYPADKTGLPLRLVLLHAAGLPAHVPFYKELPPEPADAAARRRQVADQVLSTPLAYAPGTETRYSDLGFILLGDLLEQVAGAELDLLCEQHLYGPLALADTFFVHLDRPLPKARRPLAAFAATEQCGWRGRLVRGQVHDENAYLLRGVAGHAGLFSTVGDLQVLARQLLASVAGTGAAFPCAALRAFVRRQELVSGSSRALGWDTPSTGTSCGHRFSPRAFGHTGFTGTSMWLDPEQDRFVVLLSNRVHPTRDNTAFLEFRPRLHDLVLEQFDAV
jgi:CubicO group peptidase (beta-lactamase class C family)